MPAVTEEPEIGWLAAGSKLGIVIAVGAVTSSDVGTVPDTVVVLLSVFANAGILADNAVTSAKIRLSIITVLFMLLTPNLCIPFNFNFDFS